MYFAFPIHIVYKLFTFALQRRISRKRQNYKYFLYLKQTMGVISSVTVLYAILAWFYQFGRSSRLVIMFENGCEVKYTRHAIE